MEPVRANEFVMFGALWRLEAETNCTVNNIPGDFVSMGFGADIIKLHV